MSVILKAKVDDWDKEYEFHMDIDESIASEVRSQIRQIQQRLMSDSKMPRWPWMLLLLCASVGVMFWNGFGIFSIAFMSLAAIIIAVLLVHYISREDVTEYEKNMPVKLRDMECGAYDVTHVDQK